jgi:hypothetical protein
VADQPLVDGNLVRRLYRQPTAMQRQCGERLGVILAGYSARLPTDERRQIEAINWLNCTDLLDRPIALKAVTEHRPDSAALATPGQRTDKVCGPKADTAHRPDSVPLPASPLASSSASATASHVTDRADLILSAPLSTLEKLALLALLTRSRSIDGADVVSMPAAELARLCSCHRVTAQRTVQALRRRGILRPGADGDTLQWELRAGLTASDG